MKIAAIIIGAICLFWIFWFPEEAFPAVIFFDVGQGDSALIRTGSGPLVLIDGGPDNRVLGQLGENLSYRERGIDYLIISHFHDDHITGLIETLRRFQVGRLIYAPPIPSSPLGEELLAVTREKAVELVPIKREAAIGLGPDCGLTIINPDILGVPADENNSLIVRFYCSDLRILFTGDNSARVETALLASDYELSAAVLKAAHHGSKTASGDAFLRATGAKYLIISSGADNRFGHPHPEVLARAVSLGMIIVRTDKEGSIRVSADQLRAGKRAAD